MADLTTPQELVLKRLALREAEFRLNIQRFEVRLLEMSEEEQRLRGCIAQTETEISKIAQQRADLVSAKES